jgi:hypothetical protein
LDSSNIPLLAPDFEHPVKIAVSARRYREVTMRFVFIGIKCSSMG